MDKESDAPILIVEDDLRMCEGVRVLLNSFGYDPQTSTNVPDALVLLENKPYDLIILDLQLADRCGCELLDHLEQQSLDTKVIILTGLHSEAKAINTFKKKGVVDFLHKPYDPDIFLLAVKNAIDLLRKDREHRLVDQVIISSRERYRSIVDSQKNYLCRLNISLEFTFVNQSYAEYLGSSPRQLIGKPYLPLVHKSIQRSLFRHIKAILSGSSPITVDFKIVDHKGQSHWQQWYLQNILDENDNLFEIECVGYDVTLNKIHAEKIERKKEKYRQLAEITSDWIWEVDKDGFYTYASPVVYEFLGYWPEEVIGKKPFDFMTKNEAERVEPLFRKAISERAVLKAIENTNLHKDGSLVIFETNGVPIHDDSGNFIGYRGIDRNITARKIVERELEREKEKLKEALEKVRLLSGMLPICASCKKIRDDQGYWQQIELYISEHSEADFTHSICPDCARKIYPEFYDKEDKVM